MSNRTWLLIRGLAHEKGHWKPFMGMLEKQYPADQVYGIDLPGAGIHHKMTAPISLTETLDFIRSDAHQQAEPPYLIVSISFGSMITLEWSKRHPEDLEGMVLMNTSLGRYSPFYHRLRAKMWKEYMQRLTTKDPYEIEKIILSIISNKEEGLDEIARDRAEIQKLRPVTLKNIIRQLVAAATYQSDEKSPTVPTLLLASEGDDLCAPSCSKEISKQWDIPLIMHPWAGHDLTLDAPEWVLEKIMKWLTTIECL
jgi:pimeloyl-ACP methyl ester carboxylesterase